MLRKTLSQAHKARLSDDLTVIPGSCFSPCTDLCRLQGHFSGFCSRLLSHEGRMNFHSAPLWWKACFSNHILLQSLWGVCIYMRAHLEHISEEESVLCERKFLMALFTSVHTPLIMSPPPTLFNRLKTPHAGLTKAEKWVTQCGLCVVSFCEFPFVIAITNTLSNKMSIFHSFHWKRAANHPLLERIESLKLKEISLS